MGGGGAAAGGTTIGIGITVGGYIHRTSKKMATWSTTKTLMDPNARASVSQISIVLDSLFLGHNSTHLFKVKSSRRVRALTPASGCHGVLRVGDSLHMVDTGQDADGVGTLEQDQASIVTLLQELEHLSVRIDAAQSSIKVVCLDCLADGTGPWRRRLRALDLHSLLYSYG